MASINEAKYSSIRSFRIYSSNDDAAFSAPAGTDFSGSAYTLVYNSETGGIPVFHGEDPSQDYINVPVWPLPKSVSYDGVGESHFQPVWDMLSAGTDFETAVRFQNAFNAKYLILEVTGNMDANPRVPELMVFAGNIDDPTQSGGASSPGTSSPGASSAAGSQDDDSPKTGGSLYVPLLMAMVLGASLCVVVVSRKRKA
jgi:hypothetical protein